MTDNKIEFRMSSAGACSRKLTAQYLKYDATPEPDWLADAAEEGNIHEQLVKKKLRMQNYMISSEQEELFREEQHFNIRGHIDGKITGSNMPLSLLEVKSMSQFEFDRWQKGQFEAFRQYRAQMDLYLHYTDLQQCFYAVKNRSSGYLSTQVFQRDANHYHNILRLQLKLSAVVEHILDKQLHEAEFDESNIECRRCRYQYLCRKPIVYTEQQSSVIDHATIIWRRGKSLQDEGQRLVDEARGIFEQHLNAMAMKKMLFNGLAIQLIDKSTKGYDKTKLLTMFDADTLLPALKEKKWTELRVEDTNDK